MKNANEKVDRSRLKLLGVLAAAGASGGCGQSGSTVKKAIVSKPVRESPTDPLVGLKKALSPSNPIQQVYPEDHAGGEGGGGGGGSH